MFNVMTQGYEYKIGRDYIKALETEFNININIHHKEGYNTENILTLLNNGLNQKYSRSRKGSIYKNMAFTIISILLMCYFIEFYTNIKVITGGMTLQQSLDFRVFIWELSIDGIKTA